MGIWELFAVVLLSGSLARSETPKPNVIFIMADDQGTLDLGCYGSKDLHTPHTDALAARGLRFTQFYSGAPVCSPSRACFLTGRYPVRTGLLGNAGSHRDQKAGLPASEITLAEIFKSAGYATAHIGKWHLGYDDAMRPNAQGFDFSFGFMGGCIDNYSHFYFWSGPNVHDLHRNGMEIFENGKYFPDLMLREATQFIRQQEKPFFLYYALNTPHYPYQGEPNWLEHFKDLPQPRQLYAAFVASQDERLGQLVAAVDVAGLREKTIIIFQSDNGHSTEERAHFGGGSAGPYRGAKFSLFEGGIRVPAIISWPGHLPQNEQRNQLAHMADWLPTLAALCGVKPPDVSLDGFDLTGVLHAGHAPSPRTTAHWQSDQGMNAQWAVRDGDWKLIVNTQDTSGREKQRIPLFLGNLREDPSEKTNLAETHHDIVARLRRLHEDLQPSQ